ncbi:unnamed protein product [Ectocarpus sp. 8 AP-2014]
MLPCLGPAAKQSKTNIFPPATSTTRTSYQVLASTHQPGEVLAPIFSLTVRHPADSPPSSLRQICRVYVRVFCSFRHLIRSGPSVASSPALLVDGEAPESKRRGCCE